MKNVNKNKIIQSEVKKLLELKIVADLSKEIKEIQNEIYGNGKDGLKTIITKIVCDIGALKNDNKFLKSVLLSILGTIIVEMILLMAAMVLKK